MVSDVVIPFNALHATRAFRRRLYEAGYAVENLRRLDDPRKPERLHESVYRGRELVACDDAPRWGLLVTGRKLAQPRRDFAALVIRGRLAAAERTRF